MGTVIQATDLFCGAGGTSTGMAEACQELGLGLDLFALNHWDIAVETHSVNHPLARHLCESIDNVDPRKVIPRGRLHLLVASPECTHHSNARGGRPMSDQSRASAWHIARWAEALYIDNILIENVREFISWGPLGVDGRPLKAKKGATFNAFLDALRSLGYVVDYRILRASDYGDPTTRERLFIIARRGGRKITWPEPSHSSKPLEGKIPWKTARGIIDWTTPSQSIFTRKRPLAPATLRRIAAGLKRFGGKNAEPFLVVLRNHADARSIDLPVPTVTASGTHLGLAEPFIVETIHGREDVRTHSVDEPMKTITTVDGYALVEPFIIPQFTPSRPRSVDEPLNTITTTSRGIALVEPFVVRACNDKNGSGAFSTDEPLRTLTTKDQFALVEPFVIPVANPARERSVDEPLGTLTTKDRFGLVTPDGQTVDIRFRMLQPDELARAMSFPKGYHFAGNREARVKQIGNAVPVNLARALCRELLADYRKEAKVA